MRPVLFTALVLGLASAAGLAGEAAPAFDPARLEFFERQVRPVLVENCHRCHGPDKQEGGLRLDHRETILAGGDSGPAIVPGDPEESLLIQAVRYGPDGYQMPPPGKLPDAAIAALEEWVRLDAPWPADTATAGPDPKQKFDLAERAKHWSFQPVQQVTPPDVRDKAWCQTPVDAFVLAELEARGIRPAEVVGREALLRRLSFDLTGLPPALEEIEAFVRDESPRAIETVVDRLLASPRYGERWARHWLDLVRYAEGHGHEFDFEIPHAFQYRDYVIRAFNADVPYDQFVREHVAGDMLAAPRRHPTEGFNESILGTGFFHLGEAVHSPVDILGDEAERFDNQIDVLGKTFLGLTIACARCHDHKFDAISNHDYYALAGILHSSRYQVVSFDGPQRNAPVLEELRSVMKQRQEIEREALAEAALAACAGLPDVLMAAGDARPAGWNEHLSKSAGDPGDLFWPWAKLAAVGDDQFASRRDALAAELTAHAAPPPGWIELADFSHGIPPGWFVDGEAFAASTGLRGAESGATSVRLRGALRSPTFTIERKHVWLRAGGTALVNVVVDSHRLVQGPLHGSTKVRIDHPAGLKWIALNVEDYVGHNAYVEVLDEGAEAVVVGRVGFGDEGPPADLPPPPIVAALRSAASRAALADEYRRILTAALESWRSGGAVSDELAGVVAWAIDHRPLLAAAEDQFREPVRAELAAHRARQADLESRLVEPRLAMAMADGTPEDCHVYIRGNPHKPGPLVPRRFLQALAGADQPPLATECGRLDLARRLTDPANPLVARVIVNRLWQHHFGRGIVATPDNFGRMGEPPTNQALLDWLAGELVRGGWSLKHMHRIMVLSRTYALASQPVTESMAADPKNQLWHYRPIRRLEAEVIRDAMLAVSGRLDATMYGPSVPVYLTEFMTGRGRPTESGPLDGAGRRTIYLAVRRNFLPESLTAFDYPPPFTTVGLRGSSNVPAQALYLMNNPLVAEQARRWAQRVIEECPGSPTERIERMYLMGLGRRPADDELAAAEQFVAARAGLITSDPVRPWAELAHVLFNVKEFIYVR